MMKMQNTKTNRPHYSGAGPGPMSRTGPVVNSRNMM